MVKCQQNRKQKSRAQGRFDAIAPLVQLLDLPESRRFPHLLPDGSRARTMDEALLWCAKDAERSKRSVQRYIARFKQAGRAAFEPSSRRDKGTSRFFVRHSNAAIYAAYLYRALELSVGDIHRSIIRNRELIEVPKAPCYETVRVWLRPAPPGLVALALAGQTAYRELMFSDLEFGLLAVRKDRSE
jgi:hypothetical protein